MIVLIVESFRKGNFCELSVNLIDIFAKIPVVFVNKPNLQKSPHFGFIREVVKNLR